MEMVRLYSVFFCVIFFFGCATKNPFNGPDPPLQPIVKTQVSDKSKKDKPKLNLLVHEQQDHKIAHVLIDGGIDQDLANDFRELNLLLTYDRSYKRVIIELESGGGSVCSALRIMGYMDSWKRKGIIVETWVASMAGSAAVRIFLNGQKGHRFVSKNSSLMIHQYSIVLKNTRLTLSSTRKLAENFKTNQDNFNRYIAERTKLTVTEIEKMIDDKDYYIKGPEAIAKGFADDYLP